MADTPQVTSVKLATRLGYWGFRVPSDITPAQALRTLAERFVGSTVLVVCDDSSDPWRRWPAEDLGPKESRRTGIRIADGHRGTEAWGVLLIGPISGAADLAEVPLGTWSEVWVFDAPPAPEIVVPGSETFVAYDGFDPWDRAWRAKNLGSWFWETLESIQPRLYLSMGETDLVVCARGRALALELLDLAWPETDAADEEPASGEEDARG